MGTHNNINKGLKKVGLDLVFTDGGDYLYLGIGAVEGAINVLPADNILSFCKNNVTLYQTEYNKMYTSITNFNMLNILNAAESNMDVAASAVFNCYYSAWSIVAPQTYSNLFAGNNIVFNLLYNLGYMYTDVQAIITRPHTDFGDTYGYWR